VRLYRERFLPWVMEKVLSRPEFQAQRRETLKEARGRVLEIGFGFGATLSEYPAGPGGVIELVALEPNPGMTRRAAARAAARRRSGTLGFPLRIVGASAEEMPFPGGQFDTVVTNWTLCSITDPRSALLEIRRVLRRDGRFLFLEHGRSDDPGVARLQELLTPVQRFVADGCRLDLKIDEAIGQAGLRIERLDRYEAPWGGPRFIRQMYRGAARP
jgi:ubiquinone/menaquinone biosynthesis C-methylase UbiE